MTQDKTMHEIIDDLTEQQAKFILEASVVAGHLPEYWLRKGVELSKMSKS
jgi:hypothetical protein